MMELDPNGFDLNDSPIARPLRTSPPAGQEGAER